MSAERGDVNLASPVAHSPLRIILGMEIHMRGVGIAAAAFAALVS